MIYDRLAGQLLPNYQLANIMTNTLIWLARHYVSGGKYLLGTSVALIVGSLSAATVKLDLVSRWLRLIAGSIGAFLIFFGSALLVTKLVRPEPLSQMPWPAPALTSAVGLLLIAVAWTLRRLYKRALRRRLEPVVDSAWRRIERLRVDLGLNEYITMRTPQDRAVIPELLSLVGDQRSVPIMCLTSTMGSGKSATLIELASRCYSTWLRSRRHLIVPVFVDLAAYAAEAHGSSMRNFVIRQLLRDEELVRQLEELWRDKRAGVKWLFLFDNADRALDRWQADSPNSDWAIDLAEFIRSNRVSFRAILAGRRTPYIPGAASLEIAQLSPRSRMQFLSAAGVSEVQQASFTSDKSLGFHVGNPGFLALVGPVLALSPGAVPECFYDLMADVMTERLRCLTDCQESTATEIFYRIAGRVAVLLYSRSLSEGPLALSTAIDWTGQLEGLSASAVEKVIAELLNLEILIQYSGPLNTDYLEFRHGAIQAYCAAKLLLSDRSDIVLHSMFTDPRLLLVATSLLQMGDADLAASLIATARELMQRMEPTPPASVLMVNRLLRSVNIAEREYTQNTEAGAAWSSLGYRVLYILDIGLQRRRELASDVLRDQTDRLLVRAIAQATPHEQAEILQVQNLAHDDVAAAACALGLRSNNGRLVDAAVAQLSLRSELLNLISMRDRMGFMFAVAIKGTDASAARYVSPEAALRLRLASRTGFAIPLLYWLVFGLPGIAEIINGPRSWTGPFFSVILAILATATIVGGRHKDLIRWKLIASRVRYVFGVAVVLTAFGSIDLVLTVIHVLTGNLVSIITLPVEYVVLWPFAALFYLLGDSKVLVRAWAFPFAVVVLSMWTRMRPRDYTSTSRVGMPSKRQVTSGVLLLLGVILFVIFTKVTDKHWHISGVAPTMDHELHIWLAWIIGAGIGGCVFVLPIADIRHDIRAIKLFRPNIGDVRIDRLLDWLMTLRTTSATVRLMLLVETHAQPTSEPELLQLLGDFNRFLYWVKRIDPKSKRKLSEEEWFRLPALATTGLASWLRSYDEKFPGRLRGLAKNHGSQLADYLLGSSRLIDTAITTTGGVPDR